MTGKSNISSSSSSNNNNIVLAPGGTLDEGRARFEMFHGPARRAAEAAARVPYGGRLAVQQTERTRYEQLRARMRREAALYIPTPDIQLEMIDAERLMLTPPCMCGEETSKHYHHEDGVTYFRPQPLLVGRPRKGTPLMLQKVIGRPVPEPAFTTFDSDTDDEFGHLRPLHNCEDLEAKHDRDDVIVYKLTKDLRRQEALTKASCCEAEYEERIADENKTRERIDRHRRRANALMQLDLAIRRDPNCLHLIKTRSAPNYDVDGDDQDMDEDDDDGDDNDDDG